MSLSVTEEQMAKAADGDLSLREYVEEVVRPSLPYPMQWVDRLRQMVDESPDGYAEIDELPPTTEAWQHLMRFGFGKSFLRDVGELYGLELACQNCHAMAAVRRGSEDHPRFQRFISREAQVLAQSPAKIDC